MAMVIDPICGMRIEADDAAATAEHDGQIYYFCSEACRAVFVSNPAGYGGDPGAVDADRLGAEEVAERAGISADRLRELVELGLLAPADGTFRRRDVMRARVVGELESKGLDLRALASAHASGHLTLGYLESAGRRHPRLEQTFGEFSEDIGIPIDTVQFRDLPDGFLPDWFESFDKVLALDWEKMIPGHPYAGGRIGTKDDVRAAKQYMVDLSDAVKPAADAGKCFDTAMKEVKLPKYEKWANYEQYLPGNIERFCEYWGRGY